MRGQLPHCARHYWASKEMSTREAKGAKTAVADRKRGHFCWNDESRIQKIEVSHMDP